MVEFVKSEKLKVVPSAWRISVTLGRLRRIWRMTTFRKRSGTQATFKENKSLEMKVPLEKLGDSEILRFDILRPDIAPTVTDPTSTSRFNWLLKCSRTTALAF